MMTIGILKSRYENVKKSILRKQTENEIYKTQIADNLNQISRLLDDLEVGQVALQFVEDVANSRRGLVRTQIESVITEALQEIYGLEYKIEMRYDVKNNRSFLNIIVVKDTDYGEIRRDMEGFGGGMSDTISMPLRLLVLLACRQTDKVCILDECYKHVDPGRVELVAKFLSNICRKLEMQIILCSHWEMFKDTADVIYYINDNDGIAEIKQI